MRICKIRLHETTLHNVINLSMELGYNLLGFFIYYSDINLHLFECSLLSSIGQRQQDHCIQNCISTHWLLAQKINSKEMISIKIDRWKVPKFFFLPKSSKCISRNHFEGHPRTSPFSILSCHLSLISHHKQYLCPGWRWSLCTAYLLRFSSTSWKICFSRPDVSYSFSISYSLHGSPHFWACSIISGVKHRSKRIPWMLNLGRSQRLDQGFGFIFTFN